MDGQVSSATIQRVVGVSHVAVIKATKDLPFTLVKVEGSDKPVKMYEVRLLPTKWREKLEIYIDEGEKEDGKEINDTEQHRKQASADSKEHRGASNNRGMHIAKKGNEKRHSASNRKTDDTAIRSIQGIRGRDKYLAATKEEQAEALRKAQLCEAFLRRDRGTTFEAFAKSFEGLPSRGQFFKWLSLFKQGRKSGAVLDAFIDERGRPKGSGKLTAAMKEMCERFVLRSDIHANMNGIYENVKHAFKEATPSYETIVRYINTFKETNAQLVAFATNPDKARGKYRAAFGNMSIKAKHKNHYVELDGTPADIITADGKRPAIIGAIDVYSRRVVITVEEKTNSYALSRNLRAVILKLGIPEMVVTDNGRDYKSNHFESVLINLGIEKQEVEPYAGYKKPHIERFFGTMTRELFREIEGFCGHDVAERQGIRNMLTFEQRLEAKRKWREQKYTQGSFVKALHDEGAQIFIPLTRDELAHWVHGWVEAIYERRVHGTTKETPLDRYKNDLMPARTVFDKRSLDILLGERLEYTVGKKGIVIKRDGVEAQYTAKELIELIGEKVLVVLGEDMGTIVVYRHDMSFICEATDHSLENISREASREYQRLMRKAESDKLKTVRKAEEVAQTLGDPSIKDRIEESMKSIGVDTRPTAKVNAKTALSKKPNAAAEAEPEMLNGRPIFKTDFECFIWAIENGRESEFTELIKERRDTYEMALREVERKRKAS